MLLILFDEAGERTVAIAHGEPQPRANHPLIDLALHEGPTLLSTGVGKELAVRGVTLSDPPGSWLGAPLAGSVPLGAVSVGCATPGRYVADDLNLFSAVISQATMALENARLFARLSSGKREWEQTVDAIHQAICVVDRSGAVRRANRAFGTLADRPLTDLLGTQCIALIPPTWAEAVERMLTSPGAAKSCELRAGNRQFVLTALPLGDAGAGDALLIFDDHTERRRLQDQLIQSEKMSAIGQLITGVAHDLNNPLASVIGFADYLVEGKKAPPELIEPLRAIQQEAERAANIVKNLLNFARKQEHRQHILSIEQILKSTLLLLNNQLMASKVEAELVIAPDLPPVDVNANQIQQVFVNLVANAAHAIESGGTGGHIIVRAVPWLDGVAVTIEDDGPGIPHDLTEKVFEPFFTTKPEGEGTGLGLSICQGIVKEHGGRITLTSGAQRGATFRVELPAGAAPVPKPADTPFEYGSLRILVIDDEPHIQHYMRATLEAWGHTVAIASDGAEGLTMATGGAFDVIITDLRMPELGGREMYDALCRDHPEIAKRVVFSTGDTVRGDTLSFLEGLGRPHLRKPFALAELRAVLAATAGNS